MSFVQADLGAIATSLIAAIGGGGAALMVLRRRMSRDNSEMAKDRAETNIVATLQAERVTLQSERDAALTAERVALAAHIDDARSIERLSASNDYLTHELGRANRELKRLRRLVSRLAPQAEAFMASNFAPDTLSAPPPPKPTEKNAPPEPPLWGRRETDRIDGAGADIPRKP